MQSLPLILVGGILLVMVATRGVQLVQFHVMHTLPFGALSQLNLVDTCLGVLVSGLFMMYFGVFVRQARAAPLPASSFSPSGAEGQLPPPPPHCRPLPLLPATAPSSPPHV